MIGWTGLADNFNVLLSASFIRKKADEARTEGNVETVYQSCPTNMSFFKIKDELLIIGLKKDGLRPKAPVSVSVLREGFTGTYKASEPQLSFGCGGNSGLHSLLSCTLLQKSGQSML